MNRRALYALTAAIAFGTGYGAHVLMSGVGVSSSADLTVTVSGETALAGVYRLAFKYAWELPAASSWRKSRAPVG